MKLAIATLCLVFAASNAWAQDKKEATPAQKKQQARMKDCNEKAANKKGDARKSFMSSCLKGDSGAEPSAAQKAQQNRMSACNKQATEKKLKGDERKKFMSSCLKN
jgi:hypothetical protein